MIEPPISYSRQLAQEPFNDFYVTDVEGFPAAYWDEMDARQPEYHLNLAWGDVMADLMAWLGSGYHPRQGYSGGLGQNAATQYVAVLDNTSTLPITLHSKAGGSLIITHLSMLLDTSSTVTVQLLDDQDTQLQTTILSIPARNGLPQLLDEAWIIPSNGRTYRLVATLTNGVRVGKNTLYCGGCLRNLGGLSSVLQTGDLEGYGFTMTVLSACDTELPVTRLLATPDLGPIIRRMVAYKTAWRMLFQPPTGKIERSSVLNDEDLKALLLYYDRIYREGLAWLKTQPLAINLDDTCLEARRGAMQPRLTTMFR